MKFYVYIIFSEKFGKYYIGKTENLPQRLIWHNQKEFTSSSTRFANDWEIKLKINMDNRTEARKVEKYLKSMKSKKFIQSLVNDVFFQEKFIKIILQKFNLIISMD